MGNGACNSAVDPTYAPADGHSAFWWPFAPYAIGGDPTEWDRGKAEYTERVLGVWREYASNLDDDNVRAKFLFTPLDVERLNVNMVRGAVRMGAYIPSQLGINRPHPLLSGTRTPIEGLYLCGSSTGNGGGINGAPGYIAANAIADDFKLERPWTPRAATRVAALTGTKDREIISHEPGTSNERRSSMRLKDKVAIVTGSGRGIGKDIALAYAREGAHVVINDIDPATAGSTAAEAAELGVRSLRAGRLTSPTRPDGERIVDAAMREFGRIDILVNNAMKIVPGKLEELTEEAWDTTMNIGLRGAFLMSQAAARHMIARKSGCIVNIASIAGLFPYNWAGSYSVVKAGLLMLTKQQAVEWAPYGIRANAITPGYIRTPGTEAMYVDPEIYEGRRKGVPMGRVGSRRRHRRRARSSLHRTTARYTTGSVVGADGGQAVGYFLSVPGRRFSGGRMD